MTTSIKGIWMIWKWYINKYMYMLSNLFHSNSSGSEYFLVLKGSKRLKILYKRCFMFIWTNLKMLLLFYFSLHSVIIYFHVLVWSSETRSHQENSSWFLFSGLKQSLKMSSQILCVYKCCLKRNVLILSRTISLKYMKFFLLEPFIYCT